MNTPLSAQTIVQLGTQPASDGWGSDIAPTVRLMGIDSASIVPVMASEIVGDLRGTQAPNPAHIRTIEEATCQLGGLLNYQDADYLFQALFGKDATPATDANGTFTRVYKAPLVDYDSDLVDPPSYTIIYGDVSADFGSATDTLNIVGATLNSLEISGQTGAPLRFTSGWIGKQSQYDALDATKVDRTVEFAMGDEVTLYIDPASDAVGSTPLTNVSFNFTLSVSANRTLVRHLGSLTPTKFREGKWSGSLAMQLEFNTQAAALYASIMSRPAPERVLRIKATKGSGATARTIQIDFGGVQLSAPQAWEYTDELRVLNLSFTGQYQSVLANWLKVTTLNNVSALA